jgi:hypothetical protein
MGIEYNPIVPTDGLVFWYDTANPRSFVGSGVTLRSLSSGSIMTVENGYTSFGTGAGLAISLSGTNAYTITQTNLYSQFPTAQTSMFIWAYSVGSGNIISELGQASPSIAWHDSNIEIDGSNKISMSVWHLGLTNKVVSNAINLNTWYHIGWTYDGTTFTGYINGASIGTTTFTRNRNGSAIHYTIGASDSTNMGTNANWKGMFSNFSVYNRSLSSSEVLQFYNSTKKRYEL